MKLKRLRGIASLAPVAFLALVEVVRHVFFPPLEPWVGYLALGALVVPGIYAFAAWVFNLIEGMEGEIRRQNRELGILNRIGTVLNRSLDLDTCLALALDEALQATDCEAGELFVLDKGTGEMVRRLHRGPDAELFAERSHFGPGEGFPGLVAAHGQTLLVEDLSHDHRFLRSKVQEAGFRTFASIPLKVQEKVVGTLNVATRRQGLDRDGVRLLEAIGGQIGMRVENAWLHAQVVETKDYLTRLIEGSGDAIITVDPDLKILSWNRGAKEIYGYSPEEVLGRPFHMTPPHLMQQLKDLMAPLRSGQTVRNIETQRVHKSGRLLDVVVTVSPLLDASGCIVGFAGISKDVTELKRLELDLALHQERERIGRDMHDGVIQSLYAVGLSLEACANPLGPDQQAVKERLYHAVDQLTGTIRDIRTYIFDLRPDDPLGRDPEENLVEMVEAFRINSLVETSLEIEPGLLERLSADQLVNLKHLVRECLANVSKHAAASAVHLEIRAEPAGLVLRILDNGRGFIPGEVSGAGQGLGNMAARAEALGGALRLESAPGKGTRVELQLPLDSTPEVDEAEGG